MYWFGWAIFAILALGTEIGVELNGNSWNVFCIETGKNTVPPVSTLTQNSSGVGFGSVFESPQKTGATNFETVPHYFKPEYHSKLSPIFISDTEYQIQNQIYPFHGFW